MPRKSSEAPEAVTQATEKYSGEPFSSLYRFSRKQGSYQQKEVADVQTPDLDTRSSPAVSGDKILAGEAPQHKTPATDPAVPAGGPPAFAYHDPFAPYETQFAADKQAQGLASERPVITSAETPRPTKERRVCGLITTIVLVILAFIIGAAIAGGVAGSVVAKKKSSTTSTSGSSNCNSDCSGTTSAPSSTTTTIVTVDAANCPLSNGTIYNSTTSGSSFRISCGWDILPATGTYVDVANEAELTFDDCLNYCASFNANSSNAAVGGCVAATWVIFSPTGNRNERCYLKNETGVPVLALDEGQTLASAYLISK